MTRTVSPETRAKISRSMRGKRNAAGHTMSEEGRRAVSEAQKRRWAAWRQARSGDSG